MGSRFYTARHHKYLGAVADSRETPVPLATPAAAPRRRVATWPAGQPLPTTASAPQGSGFGLVVPEPFNPETHLTPEVRFVEIDPLVTGVPSVDVGESAQVPTFAHTSVAPASLADLPIGQHPFEDLSGTAGCLHGDTSVIYLRGIRNGGRPIPLSEFYKAFNGIYNTRHGWTDRSLPTYLHSLGDDGVMFYNKVVAVYASGIKSLVRVSLADDRHLRATVDHPVMTPNGFVPAGDLKIGQAVLVKGTMQAQSSGGRDYSAQPPRVIVNTKYHPFGSPKVVRYGTVGGPVDSPTTYQYMRVHRARLVVEAALNDLPYDEFVHALKHNAELAATFRYIPTDFEVHHDDEDTLNDEIGNLMVLSKVEHARLHNQKENFRFDSYKEVQVTQVALSDEAMTYDVQMESPANNFCANGIVVHNTGKTYLAKQLLELSPPGSVVLAATTGIAAVNLGEGTTTNALLGFFNTADLIDKFTSGQIQRMLRKHRAAGLRRILIDEKSMMDGRALTVITRAIDEVNQPRSASVEAIGQEFDDDAGSDLPPQMSITLCGDFGQLPPVPDYDPADRTGKKKIPVQFAFESPEWSRYAEHRVRLTKVWRQDAQDFIAGLQAVRLGQADAALQFFTADRFSDQTDHNFAGTTIVAKNDEVDRVNQLRLDELQTPAMSSTAQRWGKQRPDWKNVPDQLRLKEGALVMLLANRRIAMDEEDERRGEMIYANGDLGILQSADLDGAWRVTIQRTGVTERVVPILRQNLIPLEPGRRKELNEQGLAHRIKEKSEIIGTIVYMPVRAAYACTVHRSQGLTLDNVQVNLRDSFFRMPGMLFVSLSRARTAAGLRIVGDQRGFMERCKVEARCLPWL